MSGIIPLLSAIITLTGAIVVLIAVTGTIRLPDTFCRSHALGKGLTLGLVLLLLGLWIDLGTEAAGLKIPAAIIFQFLTLPVSSHLVAALSQRKGIRRHGEPRIDLDRRAEKRAGSSK